MAYEFKLPDLGEGLTEGEIARWLVAEGQELAEDDPLVEIQTDKTTVEIPSPAAGTVAKILVAEGEVVPVGTVLVVIGGDGTEPAAAARAPAAPAPRRREQVSINTSSRSGDAARPPGRAGARRRSGSAERHRARTAASPRTTSAAPPERSLCLIRHKPSEGPPRARARGAAADRRAPDAGAPRGSRRHVRRGVRLHRRRREAAAAARAQGGGRRRCRSSRS